MEFDYDIDMVANADNQELARMRHRVARVSVEIERLRRSAIEAGMTPDEWMLAITAEASHAASRRIYEDK